MSNHETNWKKLKEDFTATKVVGKGKHAQVVPNCRRRLGAVKRYLRLRHGPPPRMT